MIILVFIYLMSSVRLSVCHL